MSDLVSPAELKRIADDIEAKKAREAFDLDQKRETERQKLHDAFFQREIHPEVNARVSAAVRRAAEAGQREILVVSFPSSWTTDRGRRINNSEADWPESLDGFAKRAYEYFVKELRPAGYKVRAEILNFPGGVPGDVGLYLSW
ncbi:hypothetical protein FHP25_13430 [Vineibacter terrae]|uniref:Uncharacterized protein n=1 Tax=Vineibacter terrae TaxID=2586908 RepID=A0A5C8PMJ5_9HYPH|nr:hypothetical protein [Vineibacter terrae]TXL75649.1 hypothetical protein FHP25_13430 [Vineibacter terrae]